MPDLSVTMSVVDRMSDKFASMASSGEKAISQWEEAGKIGDSAFGKTASAATSTAKAMTDAGDAADYWTDKIGTYDKSAMEAIYSTEELVEMGYKTEDALEAEARAAEDAAGANERLSEEQEELGDEFEKTSKKSKKYHEETDKSKKSTEALADVLAAVGLATMLKEIATQANACVDAFQEYQWNLAKVETLADPAAKSMKEISSEILSLSGDVGQGADALTEATYNAISAGVNTADSVDFVRQANELAVGGFTESATAVDVLTTSINAYGLSVDKTSQISDYLITTQNLGKTTVDELASSVGKVIPIAAAYGVEMDNLSTAYAVMTANGIATAETGTYLKAMLNELGQSSSTVSKVLVEETGASFASLTAQGYSLGDVMAILGESVDGNAGAFNELWGSTEAGIGALSLLNSGSERYASVLDEMRNSTGAASKAFETMANTSAFSEQKMKNSAKNLQIAFGEDLSGAFDLVYEAGAGLFSGLAFVVEKCPAVTAVVAGLTTGVAALTVAVTAHSLATKHATQIHAAWNAVKMADPIYFITAGIIAATTALAVLVTNMGDATSEYEKLTPASKRLSDEVDALNEKYEEACVTYGETSKEAKELEGELAMLRNEYEQSKQTVEEFDAMLQATKDSIAETAAAHDEAIGKINQEYSSVTALTARLEQLVTADDGAAASQAEILGIIKELNNEFPELNLNYEDVINNTGATIEALDEFAKKEYNTKKAEAAWDSYVDAMGEVSKAEKDAELAAANLAAAQARLTELQNSSDYTEYLSKIDGISKSTALGASISMQYMDIQKEVAAAAEEVAVYEAKLEDTNKAVDDATEKANSYRTEFAEASGITVEMAETTDQMSEAVSGAAYQISVLEEEYKKVYATALESISGQFSLWEQAEAVTATSVSNINTSMQSQIDYWNNYSANLDNLTGRNIEGLTEMVNTINDGSSEAAAALAGMAQATDEELATMIAKYKQLTDAEGKAAASWADAETNFTTSTKNIADDLKTTVEEMNLSEEAFAAGSNTIQGYIDAATAKTEAVRSAYARLAQAATEGWNAGKPSVPTSAAGSGGTKTGEKYASGTDNATPGWHLVGEEGPEIVYFGGGETVYPADETARMLSGTDESEFIVPAPSSSLNRSDSTEKKIIIEFNGSGSINAEGVSKETVVDLLLENLKPALLGIIQEEVFEEGAETYEY